MFGGLAFMVRGHMTVGVIGHELMVRVGKEAYGDAVAQPHAREMDFTGRPMAGMVYVAEPGFRHDAQLRGWLDRGLAYTSTLAAK
ncbi:MAG: TfoX/Sxy family protein [Actinobacteria bacterium]|nr:TfoX/Sxy family protein [Actinomycetota bacterium]